MLLLDTCTVLWLASACGRLSPRARELIEEHAGLLFVSAISAFEMGIKHRKGRLTLPLPPGDYYARAIDCHGLREIAVDGRIAELSARLPPVHADPCDRFIIATAQQHRLTVVTPDPHIAAYPDLSVSW